MIALVQLATLPICALLAVLILALLFGKTAASDRELHNYFMAFCGMFMLLSYGILQQPAVQRKLDPELQWQYQLSQHPVYVALKEYNADERGDFEALIQAAHREGRSLDDTFNALRPLFEKLLVERFGWVAEGPRVQWLAFHISTLQELSQRDAKSCSALIMQRPEGFQALAKKLSTQNQQQFQKLFVTLLKSADDGMAERAQQFSQRLEFNDIAKRYRDIEERLQQSHRAHVLAFLDASGRSALPDPVGLEAEICKARIDQLQIVLREPPAMAARIADSLLR